MEKWFRRVEGFTLVELLIVILILAVLVAIAVPIYISAIAQAKLRTCQANLRTIDGTVEQWRALNDSPGYPILSNMNNHFKGDKLPQCPSGSGSYTYDANSAAFCVNSSDHTYH